MKIQIDMTRPGAVAAVTVGSMAAANAVITAFCFGLGVQGAVDADTLRERKVQSRQYPDKGAAWMAAIV